MTLTLTLLGVFMATLGPQNVPIQNVSRTVDSAFERRFRLCPGASDDGGVYRSNDTRASVEELIAPIASIEIHQFGRSLRTLVQLRRTFVSYSRRDRALCFGLNRGRT